MPTAQKRSQGPWLALQRPRRRQLGQDCQLLVGQRPDRFSNPTDVALVHLVAGLFDGRNHSRHGVHPCQSLGTPLGRRNVVSQPVNKRIESPDSPNDRLDQTSQQAKIGPVGSIGQFLDRTTNRFVTLRSAVPAHRSDGTPVTDVVSFVEALSSEAKVLNGEFAFAESTEAKDFFFC